MSAAELSAESGVTRAYLSLIESGQRIPSGDVLRKIASGLKVDFALLDGLAGDEPSPLLSERKNQVIAALHRLRDAQQILRQKLG